MVPFTGMVHYCEFMTFHVLCCWKVKQPAKKDVTCVAGAQCTSEDYKDWSLPDNNPDAGCLLGQKLVYKRRIMHARCYNGEDFVRAKDLQNCTCTRDDFEW